jgi:hypothetical protein
MRDLSAVLVVRQLPTLLETVDGWWRRDAASLSDLFGVGDDGDLTDERFFHGRVEEEVGDVCARGRGEDWQFRDVAERDRGVAGAVLVVHQNVSNDVSNGDGFSRMAMNQSEQ